ncbi:MAG: type I-E CRISPR-associated protein Cas5/CasD [Patulibacter sp.]
MSTLRLWLEGPMQAWGTASRFEVRSTDPVPSKSGVVGLLAAALGRTRSEPVGDLAAMRFGVRVVRSGSVLRDYQAVGAGSDGVAVASGAKGRGIVTERYYLQDAAFVVGFESSDRPRLDALHVAVARPRWPLGLGRRSCPPSVPIAMPGAIVEQSLVDALAADWRPPGLASPLPRLVAIEGVSTLALAADRRLTTLVVEDDDGTIEVADQPMGAAFADRTFAARRVSHLYRIPESKERAA